MSKANAQIVKPHTNSDYWVWTDLSDGVWADLAMPAIHVDGGTPLQAALLYAPMVFDITKHADKGVEIIVEFGSIHTWYKITAFSPTHALNSFDLCLKEDWPEYTDCEMVA